MEKPESKYTEGLEKRLQSIKSYLMSQRSEIESTMDNITELFLPQRPYMRSKRAFSVLPNQDVYDQTGMLSLKVLTSLIDSQTINPSSTWFNFKAKNYSQFFDEDVTRYLQARTQAVLEIMRDPDAGFYSGTSVTLTDALGYGTGFMRIVYEPGLGFRFTPLHLSCFYIGEDAYGHVNTIMFQMEITAVQALERWGYDALNKSMKEAVDKEPYRKFLITHWVLPSEIYNPYKKQGYKNYKYKSCYTVEGNEDGDGDTDEFVLEESFLSYNPYNVFRWFKNHNSPWGIGASRQSMPNVQTVQLMEMSIQAATQKALEPPILTTDDGILLPDDLEPGVYISGALDGNTLQPKMQPMLFGSIPPFVDRLLESKKKDIQKAFYNSSIIFSDLPQMTREEVLARKEEQLLMIAPDLKLYMEEHLIPSIRKVDQLMMENKLFPEPPPEIKDVINQGLVIEFNTPLLNYHRLSELSSARALFQEVVNFAQVFPELPGRFNAQRTMDVLLDGTNAPLQMVNTKDEQKAIEQQQQAQRQRAEQFNMAKEADKSKYMIQQAGGDPNTSTTAAMMQQSSGTPNTGGFDGL